MATETFKEAIKSDVRESKGYCLVHYTVPEGIPPISLEYPLMHPLSNFEEITSLYGVKRNYAILDRNYVKNDGSFILPNNPTLTINEKVGFISPLIGNYFFNTIHLAFPIYVNRGITLHFDKEDFPVDFTISIYWTNSIESEREDFNFTNNNEKSVMLDFVNSGAWNSNFLIEGIGINVSKLSNPQHCFKLSGLVFGLQETIEKNERMVSMKVIEEIDITNKKFPTNEFELKLINFDNQYRVEYLEDKNFANIFQPFLGVTNKYGVDEYENLGNFFLNKYTNENYEYLNIYTKREIKELEANPFVSYRGNRISNLLEEIGIYNYEIDFIEDTYVANMFIFKEITAKDYLNFLLTINGAYMFIERDRNNTLKIKKIDNNLIDSYDLSNFKKMPNLSDEKQIKKVIIKNNKYVDVANEERNIFEENINGTYSIERNVEIPTFFNLDIEGNIEILEWKETLYSFKGLLKANSPSKFYVKGTELLFKEDIFEKNNVDNGETITLNFKTMRNINLNLEQCANNILNTDYNQKTLIESQMDPSMKVGNKIAIETKEGMKNIIVQKLQFDFDGALEGIIEGAVKG